MPEMPQRPREHVLADEAEEAFKAFLPHEWIYRSKSSDYGVDGEVELVSPEGGLTGRLFYVQLKGTDIDSLKDALNVRLKISTANYFRALDLPVLIVRYHAPTRRVYARWFESVSNSLPATGQDTVSVQLSENDEYGASRSAAIPTELENIRVVKFNKLKLPIGIELSGQFREFAAAEVVSAMKSLAGADIARFDSGGAIKVAVGDEQTEISIGVVHKSAFPTGELSNQGSLKGFAANTLGAVGIALGRVQQAHVGAPLIALTARSGDLLARFPYGIEAAFCLAADTRVGEALDIAQSLICKGDALELAQVMAMVPIFARSMHGSRALHTEILRKIVAESERRADATFCATAQYNLANHLHSTGRRREALRYYHSALRSDNRYAGCSYIWREIGVLLFESRHFRPAAVCYERAIARGDRGCKPYLADALMWSGDYDRATAGFEAYLNSVELPPSEWVLKHSFLQRLHEAIGVGVQQRRRVLALQLANPRDGTFEESQFRAAVQADGLCGLAWFNFAHSKVVAQDYEKATEHFTAAALCQPNDLQAWCSAAGCAMNCRRYDLLAHIISAAYRVCREEFSSALFELVKRQPAQFPKGKVIEMLGKIISEVPEMRLPSSVRIFTNR